MDKQLTKEEAIAIYNAEDWKDWDAKKVVSVQLFQDHLCAPFDVFHKAMEEILSRPVWTHEFASAERLRGEYLKARTKPSFEEIIGLVPQDKLILVIT